MYSILLDETKMRQVDPVAGGKGEHPYGDDMRPGPLRPVALPVARRRYPPQYSSGKGGCCPTSYAGLGATYPVDAYGTFAPPVQYEGPVDSVSHNWMDDWGEIFKQGIATTPAIIAASKKSPVPGYPGSTPSYGYPTYDARGSGYPQSGGINLSGGISTQTLMIVGLIGAFFLLGGGRGKR